VRSGRLQGFIPQKLAHFEEHILTLHTVRDRWRDLCDVCRTSVMSAMNSVL
jgi:hypothetical protein